MVMDEKDERDLCKSIIEKYNYTVYDIIPTRKVFILFTDKGNKVLKEIGYNIKHLDFINSAMDYLKQNNFKNIIEYEKNNDGEYYTQYKNKNYTIINLIEGKECEFNNPIELKFVAQSLAKMHNASEGFRYKDNSYRYKPGTLIEEFTIKKEELKIFKSLLENYDKESKFNNIFVENLDSNLADIDKSIELLKKYQYLKVCSYEDKIVLCHNDLVYHNVIINKNDIFFIDFDYCMIDLRVHDLCNFINKVIKNFGFDFEKARLILDEYNKYYKLEKIDIQILYAMLVFPKGFYSIVKDYYKRKKNWDEETFVMRLERKVRHEEDRKQFLENFKKYYEL